MSKKKSTTLPSVTELFSQSWNDLVMNLSNLIVWEVLRILFSILVVIALIIIGGVMLASTGLVGHISQATQGNMDFWQNPEVYKKVGAVGLVLILVLVAGSIYVGQVLIVGRC